MYDESQHVYHSHFPVHPDVGERVEAEAASKIGDAIIGQLRAEAHNKEYFKDHPLLRIVPRRALQAWLTPAFRRPPIRLVEKTPANSLRIPFLAALFPDAKFIVLVRRAEDVISSLMEGWKFWSRTECGEWHYTKWHYLVPPGWNEWTGRTLQEICAFQWVSSVTHAWDDVQQYANGRFILVRHEDALADPHGVYRNILEFCELPVSAYWDRQFTKVQGQAFVRHGSKPKVNKWKELHGAEVESVRHLFAPVMQQFYPEAGES
jgi:hypothetical protein